MSAVCERPDAPGCKRPPLEDRLSTVKFNPAREPHIKLDGGKCASCVERVCLHICPAGNYREDPADTRRVLLSWESCMECGACRMACPRGALEWSYPVGGRGLSYRCG